MCAKLLLLGVLCNLYFDSHTVTPYTILTYLSHQSTTSYA